MRQCIVSCSLLLLLGMLGGCQPEERAEPRPRAVSVSEDVTLNYRSIDNPIVLFARLDQEIKHWQAGKNSGDHSRVLSKEVLLEELTRGNFSALASSLKKDKESFRRIAAMALGFSHEARAIAPLVEALRDSSPQVRSNTLISLGNLHQESTPVKPITEMLLLDKDPSVRSHAAYALFLILKPQRDRGCMMPLIKATEDPDPSVRAHAALALASIQSDFAVPTLTSRSLFDEHLSVRYNAALALGEIGSRDAIAPLVEALKRDRHPQVRKAVAAALHKLTGKNFGQNSARWNVWIKANLGDLQREAGPKTGGEDGPEGKEEEEEEGDK